MTEVYTPPEERKHLPPNRQFIVVNTSDILIVRIIINSLQLSYAALILVSVPVSVVK